MEKHDFDYCTCTDPEEVHCKMCRTEEDDPVHDVKPIAPKHDGSKHYYAENFGKITCDTDLSTHPSKHDIQIRELTDEVRQAREDGYIKGLEDGRKSEVHVSELEQQLKERDAVIAEWKSKYEGAKIAFNSACNAELRMSAYSEQVDVMVNHAERIAALANSETEKQK